MDVLTAFVYTVLGVFGVITIYYIGVFIVMVVSMKQVQKLFKETDNE